MNASENAHQHKVVFVSSTTTGACMFVPTKVLYSENSHIDLMCLKLNSMYLEEPEFFAHLSFLEKKNYYLGYTFQVLLYCRSKF